MRFLAEAAWYPTALLPSQGVRWDAIDDTSARASLVDDVTTVSLVFRFDVQGLIYSAHAAARYRTVNGALVATPGKADSGRMKCGAACVFPCTVKWRGCFQMAYCPTGAVALPTSSMSWRDE